MIITTTDPITGEHLHDLRAKPFVIEGQGNLAVKVYFESEETRRTYIRDQQLPAPALRNRPPAQTDCER